MTMPLLANIDVDDVERAIDFYRPGQDPLDPDEEPALTAEVPVTAQRVIVE